MTNDTERQRATSNRHPVDALADVRARLRELKAEEDRLKDCIRSSRAFNGEEFTAVDTTQAISRFDRDAMEKVYGKAAVARFFVKTETQILKLRPRAEDEAKLKARSADQDIFG